MKSLPEQVREAERVFRQAYKSKPRSGRTMRLHWQWKMLIVELLNHRPTDPASVPIGHQEVAFA